MIVLFVERLRNQESLYMILWNPPPRRSSAINSDFLPTTTRVFEDRYDIIVLVLDSYVAVFIVIIIIIIILLVVVVVVVVVE